MKKLLLLLAVSMLSLAVASASPINCSVSGLGAGGAVDSSTVIVCGGLTFDDFSVPNATGTGNLGVIDLIGTPTYDSVTGDVVLNFNPNLTGNQDDDFMFAVWGGVIQISLSVGGTDATIFEEACANPVPTSGPLVGLCVNSTGTASVPPLGSITVSSGEPGQPILSPTFSSTSPVYIWKDINEDGGLLSEFSQDFVPSTPEPVSMILLGSGLLGLGLLRRRSRKN